MLYNSDKKYIGYHSFNNIDSGQIPLMNNGYFRIYTNNDYDGLCYLSNNVPDDVIDYKCTKELVEKDDKKRTIVVNLGDSIFGNIQDFTSISAQMEKMDGNIYYNCGLGGTELASRNNEYWTTLSATELVDSICSNDFVRQDDALNSGIYFPSYFYDTLEFLKKIDWDDVDVVTFAYGTNDYTDGIVIENDNLYDTHTYIGALRHIVEKMQETYPHIKLLFVTPIWRYFEDGTDSDTKNYSGTGTLLDYKNALVASCKKERIPCLDSYEEMPLSQYNADYYFQTDDRTHLNENGRKLYANLIRAKISTLSSN